MGYITWRSSSEQALQPQVIGQRQQESLRSIFGDAAVQAAVAVAVEAAVEVPLTVQEQAQAALQQGLLS